MVFDAVEDLLADVSGCRLFFLWKTLAIQGSHHNIHEIIQTCINKGGYVWGVEGEEEFLKLWIWNGTLPL